MEPKEILSEREAAEFVGCDVKTLSRARLAKAAIFPFVMVGDRPMYARSAILASFHGDIHDCARDKPTTSPRSMPTPAPKRKPGRPRNVG